MGQFIHRNGSEYRVWSTFTDSYVTTAGDRDGIAEYLLEEAIAEAKKDIAERLARADANGTSAMFGKRDATKWDEERCGVCLAWHHPFVSKGGIGRAGCDRCGDPRRKPWHGPLCEVKEPE